MGASVVFGALRLLSQCRSDLLTVSSRPECSTNKMSQSTKELSQEIPGLGSFGERLRWIRKRVRCETLAEMGTLIGCTPSYLSKLETRRSTNPTEALISAICQRCGLARGWLVQGEGEPFTQAPIDAATRKADEDENQAEEKARAVFDALIRIHRATPRLVEALLALVDREFREISEHDWRIARHLISEISSRLTEYPAPSQGKFLLTDVGLGHTSSAVPPLLAKLIDRVRTATVKRGSRAALARLLGVERGVLNAWLSGRHQPGGEHTLRLLHWVGQQERGQR